MLKKHRNNLEKLGKYLASLSLEYNQQHFNMAVFVAHRGNTQIGPIEAHALFETCICGTTACAVGHAAVLFPRAISNLSKKLYKTRNRPARFWDICEDLFGIKSSDEAWNWLFDQDWAMSLDPYNSTSYGCADRIACYLDEGVPDINNNENFSWACASFYEDEAEKIQGVIVDKGWIAKDKYDSIVKELEEEYA